MTIERARRTDVGLLLLLERQPRGCARCSFLLRGSVVLKRVCAPLGTTGSVAAMMYLARLRASG